MFLAAALLIYRFAKVFAIQDKYLDYRALSEGLRVKFFGTYLAWKKKLQIVI